LLKGKVYFAINGENCLNYLAIRSVSAFVHILHWVHITSSKVSVVEWLVAMPDVRAEGRARAKRGLQIWLNTFYGI